MKGLDKSGPTNDIDGDTELLKSKLLLLLIFQQLLSIVNQFIIYRKFGKCINICIKLAKMCN